MAFTKMLWASSAPTSIGSWDFWTSVTGDFLTFYTDFDATYYRLDKSPKFAYYGICFSESVYGSNYRMVHFIVMSPDPDATTVRVWSGSSSTLTYYNSTITDSNGITWYVNGFNVPFVINLNGTFNFSEQCFLNDWNNPYPNLYQQPAVKDQIIQSMLDGIYAVPFHEDYQVGNSYNLNLADKKQTLHKALGAYLWWNVGRYVYSTKVTTLSDRVEDIIADLVPTSFNYFCYVYIDENLSGNEILRFYYVNTGGLSGTLNSKGSQHDYNIAYFENTTLPASISYTSVLIPSLGNYTLQNGTDTALYPYASKVVPVGLDLDSNAVGMSNAGIDL